MTVDIDDGTGQARPAVGQDVAPGAPGDQAHCRHLADDTTDHTRSNSRRTASHPHRQDDRCADNPHTWALRDRPTWAGRTCAPRSHSAGLGCRVCDAARFPPRERTLRLAERVAAYFDDCGGYREHTTSRVLESSTMLALLRREQRYPDVQSRLLRFIAAAHADPELNPVERTVAETALGLATGTATGDPLAGFAHHTSNRKRPMFGAYLAVLGGGTYPEQTASLPYQDETTWGALTACSLKALTADGLDRPGTFTAHDRDFLCSQLAAGRQEIWKAMSASTLWRCWPCALSTPTATSSAMASTPS